jgi:hypothetical protein
MAIFEGPDRNRNIIIAVVLVVVIAVIITFTHEVVCAGCFAKDCQLRGRLRGKHRMFDVVVKSVAVPNALERKPGRRWNQFGQTRMRKSEPAIHVRGEKRAQCLRRQFHVLSHGSSGARRIGHQVPLRVTGHPFPRRLSHSPLSHTP